MGRKVIEAFIQEGLFSGEREYVQFFNHLKNSLRGTGWNYHNETSFTVENHNHLSLIQSLVY